MSQQLEPVSTTRQTRPAGRASDASDGEAYDRLRAAIRDEMDAQLLPSLSRDPRVAELDSLDADCFSENPWGTYRASCPTRCEGPLDRYLKECRASHMEFLEAEAKTGGEHRQGRERFHTLLESLVLEHVPAFIARHPDLTAQYASITGHGEGFMGRVHGDFLRTLESACEGIGSE